MEALAALSRFRDINVGQELLEGALMRQAVAYVSFNGQCVDAFQFYAEALDGHVESVTIHKDHPHPHQPRKVRHAVLHLDGLTVVGSDGLSERSCRNQYRFSLTMEIPCAQKARQAFLALAEEGIVVNPLQTIEGNGLGLVIDQFEILWTVLNSGVSGSEEPDHWSASHQGDGVDAPCTASRLPQGQSNVLGAASGVRPLTNNKSR